MPSLAPRYLQTANGLTVLEVRHQAVFENGDLVVVEREGQYQLGIYESQRQSQQIRIGKRKISLANCSIIGLALVSRILTCVACALLFPPG